ncbi:HNH endonuclease [Erysipelothrix rhusiopathiae]|nr:HNH endonuclease [Erysipelothrix rhusiopathiae]
MKKNTEVSRVIEYIKLLKFKSCSSSFEITSGEIGHALKSKNHRNISRAMLDDQLKPFEIMHIAPNDANYSSRTKIKYYSTKNSALSHYLIDPSILNDSYLDESDTDLYEGSQKKVFVNKYERNPEARKLCLENYGYTCQMCKLSMDETYGEYGKNFIHVHHRKPISEIGTEYKVNPIDDLIPLCPNCHEIIHRIQRAGYTPTQSETILKQILEQRKNI